MKFSLGASATLLLAAGFIAGCSSNLNPASSEEEAFTYNGAKVVSAAALPACDSDAEGALYYVLNSSEFKYCDGSAYLVIDLQGVEGASGEDGASISWLGSKTEKPDLPSLFSAYFNTSDNKAYIWDGTAWQTLAVSGQDGADGLSILWQGSRAAPPKTPELNWAYYNSADGVSYIYNGTEWDTLAANGLDGANGTDGISGADGANGVDGTNGADGLDGVSIIWKGERASAPAAPQINWAYFNTARGVAYIYSGAAWDTLAVSGADGTNGADGANGINGSNGVDGQNGKSLIWKGELAAPPASPDTNWAYYNTSESVSYIYSGSSWDTLAVGGKDFDPLVDTIDVSHITGVLGQGYTLNFPDVAHNTTRLEIESVVITDSAVIVSGPGWDIERIPGFTPQGVPDDMPGLSQEHPLFIELSGADAAAVKSYFDNYPGQGIRRAGSIIIPNALGTEVCRWNFFDFRPVAYSAGVDGRTRFEFQQNQPPDRLTYYQPSSDIFGTGGSYNPATDKKVEISSVGATGFYPEVTVDTASRTLSFTYDYGDGGGIYAWVRLIILGNPDLRSISVITLNDSLIEISRMNYYGCFPIKYEVLTGFGLDISLTGRLTLSYNVSSPG